MGRKNNKNCEEIIIQKSNQINLNYPIKNK
jgi:hypothetical protein